MPLIKQLPHEIGGLKRLKILLIEQSGLSSIPSTIGELTNLEALDLSDNEITYLPEVILRLNKLSYIDGKMRNDGESIAELVHRAGYKISRDQKLIEPLFNLYDRFMIDILLIINENVGSLSVEKTFKLLNDALIDKLENPNEFECFDINDSSDELKKWLDARPNKRDQLCTRLLENDLVKIEQNRNTRYFTITAKGEDFVKRPPFPRVCIKK